MINAHIEELARIFCGASQESWSCQHCRAMFLAARECQWLERARSAVNDGWRKELIEEPGERLDKEHGNVV